MVDGEEDLSSGSGKDSEAMVLLSIDWDFNLSELNLFLSSWTDEEFEVPIRLHFREKEEVGAALVKLKPSFSNNCVGTIKII